MDDGFYLFSEYRDEGNQARHYICGDYHLWVWTDVADAIAKFEFQYKDKRVKFCDGEFNRGSENLVMPMFFILDQLFECDEGILARLMGIRDDYVPEAQASRPEEAGESLSLIM